MSGAPPVKGEVFGFSGTVVTSSWIEETTVGVEEWLIDGLVPRASYTGIFGRRGAAKSFLALDMACRGAAGLPFLGRETERFGSVYCVGEKKSRFGKRIEAWKLTNGAERTPSGVLFRWGCPNLLDEAEVGDFIAEVSALRPEFIRRGAPLRAVFLDTLARCLKHRNVSDPDASGTAIEAIQRIVDECGVTVLPLAHVAKADGSLTQKGAGEWEDAADALIRIDRKEQEATRTVTLTKQSDEADGLAFAFELEVIDVGVSAGGKRINSCVIRQVEAPESGTSHAHVRLNAAAMLVSRALSRLLDEGQAGFVPPAPGVDPGKTRGVTLDQLRDQAFALGLQRPSEPPGDAPDVERRKWLDARKKAFQRAVERLQEARKIRQEGNWVWEI
ncbi:AAA family ATPase [Phenylobacterium sp.]|uniref:AAA family ATPase n=1 Tax=Phenylobacterium sp. TaxID=1871053 RepID=UPI00286AACD7|nr:AAA family ATPase [Phenylobacterium sp.]